MSGMKDSYPQDYFYYEVGLDYFKYWHIDHFEILPRYI